LKWEVMLLTSLTVVCFVTYILNSIALGIKAAKPLSQLQTFYFTVAAIFAATSLGCLGCRNQNLAAVFKNQNNPNHSDKKDHNGIVLTFLIESIGVRHPTAEQKKKKEENPLRAKEKLSQFQSEGKELLECPHCNLKYFNKLDYDQHMAQKKHFMCQLCFKLFVTSKGVEDHMIEKHPLCSQYNIAPDPWYIAQIAKNIAIRLICNRNFRLSITFVQCV